jgi:hypothetical protein
MKRALREGEGSPHQCVHEVMPTARPCGHHAIERDTRVVQRPSVDRPAPPASRGCENKSHRWLTVEYVCKSLDGWKVAAAVESLRRSSEWPKVRVAREQLWIERDGAPDRDKRPHMFA